jgi:hypothetical protein
VPKIQPPLERRLPAGWSSGILPLLPRYRHTAPIF